MSFKKGRKKEDMRQLLELLSSQNMERKKWQQTMKIKNLYIKPHIQTPYTCIHNRAQ